MNALQVTLVVMGLILLLGAIDIAVLIRNGEADGLKSLDEVLP
jgi:hypothetical protein